MIKTWKNKRNNLGLRVGKPLNAGILVYTLFNGRFWIEELMSWIEQVKALLIPVLFL